MLKILLCEDDRKQRLGLEKIIDSYLMEHTIDMTFALSAESPEEILHFLEREPDTKGIYFLDIDLQHEINGIDLSIRIREKDFDAKIIFITTHEEMAGLVFKHKVEALDYIVKDNDDVKMRIRECLDVVYERHMSQLVSSEEYFTIRTKKYTSNLPISEILFFETDISARNRIIIHTTDGQITFRGTMKEIDGTHEDFFLCHKSVIVNVKNIKNVDRTQKTLLMANGETIPIAIRKMTALQKLLPA